MSESTRILIVDDSPEDRESYKRFLRQSRDGEYAFDEADTAEGAMDAIHNASHDCVLLDFRLPDADGLDVLAAIAARDFAPPVVVLTGQGNESVAVRAMKTGAQDYLVKGSMSADVLGRAVRNAIEKGRLQENLRRQAIELARANLALQRAADDLERKVAERTAELQRALQLKDEFLATVSHELRTPLNAILGWSVVLREAFPSEEVRQQALASIERNVRWQTNLIDDILDVSRIATGKLHLQPRPIDLADVLDSALDVVRPAAANKQLALDVSMARPAWTFGDPDRLRQSLWNLLANAVKFTPPGGRVRARLESSQSDHRVVVEDTGIGIDPAFMPQMFEPFRQADGTLTRRHGGLGLGLSIARQILEASGGSLLAQSPGVGLGATFTATLPAREAPRGAVTEAPMRPHATGARLHGIRVLVVDDDEDTRAVLARLLESRGAQVTTAGTAEAALALMESDTPHAVLTDLGMPEVDGFALMQRLRAHADLRVRNIPCAAITAFAGDVVAARALDAGFAAHLPKPIDAALLVELVSRLAMADRATR